jgi:hypothetical protein
LVVRVLIRLVDGMVALIALAAVMAVAVLPTSQVLEEHGIQATDFPTVLWWLVAAVVPVPVLVPMPEAGLLVPMCRIITKSHGRQIVAADLHAQVRLESVAAVAAGMVVLVRMLVATLDSRGYVPYLTSSLIEGQTRSQKNSVYVMH